MLATQTTWSFVLESMMAMNVRVHRVLQTTRMVFARDPIEAHLLVHLACCRRSWKHEGETCSARHAHERATTVAAYSFSCTTLSLRPLPTLPP